jgi:integrase
MSPGRASLMVAALRSFLRFLHLRGEIATDLAGAVPTVPNWRFSTVPKFLEPAQVERLLKSCDQSTIIGQRDYAILLLLARLGLRAGEVAGLTLDDIDWGAGRSPCGEKALGMIASRFPVTSARRWSGTCAMGARAVPPGRSSSTREPPAEASYPRRRRRRSGSRPASLFAFATLNAMAPGRIDRGIGTGFTARRTMALGPLKLSAMAEYLRVMKELWQGKTTTVELEGEPRKIRFMNPYARQATPSTIQTLTMRILHSRGSGRRRLGASILV